MQDRTGIFKGFSEAGLEFKAEIITHYHTECTPLLGSFILVSIDQEHAILGRITKFFPVGVMSSWDGEDYLATLSRMKKEVPEDLKESKLRYNVNVKLLGGIENSNNGSFKYTPSIRRLPHLGAIVGMPTDEVLTIICKLGVTEDAEPVEIGFLSLGDRVFDGENALPKLPIRFDIKHLISRRSYVFARAGYGKSILIKLLITKLYEKEQDCGMLIFDPEGEYAFPDKKGRPGLACIPELASKIVVFTDRKDPNLSNEFKRMIAGQVKLNLSEFDSSDVVNLCISEGKQESVFASRLRAMYKNNWKELLDLIQEKRYDISDDDIIRLAKTDDTKAVIPAIRNNLPPIVFSLHNRNSKMMEQIKFHLKKGHIVIVDVSLVSSTASNQIAGLILNELFKHNLENFSAGSERELIKVITVIEEAQSVLSSAMNDKSPFVRWAKEGRKYDLGSILITQQPGSIATELLSQGDNFFAFHLLSEHDLRALQGCNAHFSNDILASILNEPIKGNAYFWSAPDQPFVLATKIIDFEKYAKEKRKNVKNKFIEKTACEEFRGTLTNLDKQMEEIVKRAIETDNRISLYSNLTLNGKKENGLLASKLWNLKFTIGKTLPPELSDFYGEQKGGDLAIKDSALINCLKKLELLSPLERMCVNGENTQYLILLQGKINTTKKFKLEEIALIDCKMAKNSSIKISKEQKILPQVSQTVLNL